MGRINVAWAEQKSRLVLLQVNWLTGEIRVNMARLDSGGMRLLAQIGLNRAEPTMPIWSSRPHVKVKVARLSHAVTGHKPGGIRQQHVFPETVLRARGA